MDSREFLKTVLPEEGYYCLARPHEKGYFLHRVVSDVDDVVRIADEMDSKLYDVYFAVASLREARVFDPAKNDGKGGYRYRTKSNILKLKSVFFEADVLRPDELEKASEDELERKYTSQDEAIKGIKKFCRAIRWPLPMVVSSGWGFHFYWPLREAVEPQRYEVLIKKLKLAAKHFKFKLDVSAADVSRVFRVPGTHNNKDPHNRKVVQVLKPTDPVDFESLETSLNEVLEAASVSTEAIQERMPIPDYLNFGESNVDDFNEPLKLRPIVEKCGAIRKVIEEPDDASYHAWYHTLQVVRFCEDGEKLAHKISSLGSDYDADETDKMLRSLREKGIGPTLCDTFSEESSACATCPYRHKIRSPAAFGRDIKAAKENAQRSMQAAIGKIPPPPWPYKHVDGKGVLVERTDKDGTAYEDIIYDYDLTPVKRLFSERDQREVTIWQTNNASDGFVEIEIPSAALYDKRNFSVALADAGLYCSLDRVDHLRAYMVAYVQELQRLFMKEFMYSRVGWRDGTMFVLGDKLYKESVITPCNIDRSGRVMPSIETSGTLEKWQEVLTFFEGRKFAGHQFGIGIGFGAPLLQFTGISGGIVNMLGQSGEGKSTIQKVVNSIWGHPTKLMLPAEARSSTYNAKISFINTMNNLPICAEEITNSTQDEIGSLAYAITQGSEKWRADIKGNVRESTGGWCTILLSSSNTSLHEQLDGHGGAVAKALRIFEYRLERIREHTKEAFQKGVDLELVENYGLAGPRYIEHLVNHRESIRRELLDTMVKLDRRLGLLPEERIWSAIFACCVTALRITKEIGMHNFDPEDVEEFIHRQVSRSRQVIEGMKPVSSELISQFLNANIQSMLVVDEQNIGGKLNYFPLHEPRYRLETRYEPANGHIWIMASALRRWCQENGHIYGQLLDELQEEDMLISSDTKKVLSSGSELSSGQVRCIQIDADSPLFRGGIRKVVNSIDNLKSNTGKTHELPRRS